MPDSALKCIESWHMFLPHYEIKEWNEDNFDVNIIPYTQQAYEAHKYAFVSDYARFWILYNFGGLYFDTDVEIIGPIDDIVATGPFMGIEKGARLNHLPMVNPGLGLGAEPNHPFYKRMLLRYQDHPFILNNGAFNPDAIVKLTTIELQSDGLKATDEIQKVSNIWIYPPDYFCPLDSTTGLLTITDRSVSIHHFAGSWIARGFCHNLRHFTKLLFVRLFGEKLIVTLSEIITMRFFKKNLWNS